MLIMINGDNKMNMKRDYFFKTSFTTVKHHESLKFNRDPDGHKIKPAVLLIDQT